MAKAKLTISSKNYSSWSLRGWLLCKLAELEIEEEVVPIDDPSMRAELLLLSPSCLVPCLTHDGIKIWDTLAIAEYLAELKPQSRLLPKELKARSHCRSISGEMHSGFYNLRSALPMNLRARNEGFQVFPGARADIERIVTIWRDCLKTYGGPYLFGPLTMADAMYAPVCTRFLTYDVKLDDLCSDYCRSIMVWPAMEQWVTDAKAEPEELEELDAEF
jgi:glutathione S-transferase